MFQRLSERAARLGKVRAARRRKLLAERLQEIAPPGVGVAVQDEAVVLQTRGRFAGDLELRWLVAEARDG